MTSSRKWSCLGAWCQSWALLRRLLARWCLLQGMPLVSSTYGDWGGSVTLGQFGCKTFKYCETWGHHHTWCQRTRGWHRLQRGEEPSYLLSALVRTDAEGFISLTFCHMCTFQFWDRDDILAKLTSQYGIFQFAIHALMFVFNFSCQK